MNDARGKILLETLKKLTGVKVVCMRCAHKDPHCASAEKDKVYGKSKVLKRQNETSRPSLITW